jgi:hypothetical protein
VPFLTADRFDKFWGAKLVARFTRAQLRAAVEAGKLTDRRAVDYITDTLVARQRATAKYWFDRVTPLDRFTIEAGALCFDDLAMVYGVGESSGYAIIAYTPDGHALGPAQTIPVRAGGHVCASIPLARGDSDYTVVELASLRSERTAAVDVHVARDPTSRDLRVIGVWRR